MASLMRFNVCRYLGYKTYKGLFIKEDINFVRTISSKAIRDKDPNVAKKPKPWPYNHKSYYMWNYFFDKTTNRLDENSKIIVVEGPVASGKTQFAKQLAADLDMYYLPEANLDMLYINDYGFDKRTLDSQLPDSCKSFDVNNFLVNPKHRLSATFQIKQYCIKYSQYIDALAHLFSTGQGVVLDRCVYSDFIFLEAMYKQKLITRAAREAYYEIKKNSMDELLRPHLVIYLDVPVAKTQANIQKRAIPYECKSSALTTEYLTDLEKQYKQNYLKNISQHSELLVYDWSEGGEAEVVVEDIERIDFDNYEIQEPKMRDWLEIENEEDWGVLRHKFADTKDFLMTFLNVPCYNVPELVIGAEDAEQYNQVMDSAPGEQFAKGYNKNMGDTGLLLKMKVPHRDTLPLRERRIHSA